jgi:hypothetical protein
MPAQELIRTIKDEGKEFVLSVVVATKAFFNNTNLWAASLSRTRQ